MFVSVLNVGKIHPPKATLAAYPTSIPSFTAPGIVVGIQEWPGASATCELAHAVV
jgi:hypothetical protein